MAGWYDNPSSSVGMASALDAMSKTRSGLLGAGIASAGDTLAKYGSNLISQQQAQQESDRRDAESQRAQEALDINKAQWANTLANQSKNEQEAYNTKLSMLSDLARSKPVSYKGQTLWGGVSGEGFTPDSIAALSATEMTPEEKAQVSSQLPSLASLQLKLGDRDKAEMLKANRISADDAKALSYAQIEAGRQQAAAARQQALQAQQEIMQNNLLNQYSTHYDNMKKSIKIDPTTNHVEYMKALAQGEQELQKMYAPRFKALGMSVGVANNNDQMLNNISNEVNNPNIVKPTFSAYLSGLSQEQRDALTTLRNNSGNWFNTPDETRSINKAKLFLKNQGFSDAGIQKMIKARN